MPRRTTFILVSLAFSVTLIGNTLGVAYAQEESRRILRRVERDVDRDVNRDVRKNERNNGIYGQTGTNPDGQAISPRAQTQDSLTNPNTSSSVQATSGDAAAKVDSMSDMSQTEQMRMQNAMDRRAKAEEAASNLMKKESDTQNSIINNMK
jgi:hypothetical protein